MLAERNPTTSSVMLKQFFSTTRSDFPQGSYDTGINGLISGTIAVNGADLTIDQFAEVCIIWEITYLCTAEFSFQSQTVDAGMFTQY